MCIYHILGRVQWGMAPFARVTTSETTATAIGGKQAQGGNGPVYPLAREDIQVEVKRSRAWDWIGLDGEGEERGMVDSQHLAGENPNLLLPCRCRCGDDNIILRNEGGHNSGWRRDILRRQQDIRQTESQRKEERAKTVTRLSVGPPLTRSPKDLPKPPMGWVDV